MNPGCGSLSSLVGRTVTALYLANQWRPTTGEIVGWCLDQKHDDPARLLVMDEDGTLCWHNSTIVKVDPSEPND